MWKIIGLQELLNIKLKKHIKTVKKIIEEKIVPKVGKNHNTKYRNNRGIVIYDYRS